MINNNYKYESNDKDERYNQVEINCNIHLSKILYKQPQKGE